MATARHAACSFLSEDYVIALPGARGRTCPPGYEGLGCAYSLGQGTDLGTIRGTVTDSSGAVVANASVSVIDRATAAARETKANGQGQNNQNSAAILHLHDGSPY
jgi:hypothetical protein